MLYEEIRASLKDAMKAKDEVKLRTIRSMLTAFTNEMVAKGKTPQDIPDDETILAVIKKLAKQRKDSIEQYEAAGRQDLSAPEKLELVILDAYLPTMMTQEEIEPVAKTKMAELGVTDKSKMGILVGSVMKELAGKADGSDVKAVIEKLLSS